MAPVRTFTEDLVSARPGSLLHTRPLLQPHISPAPSGPVLSPDTEAQAGKQHAHLTPLMSAKRTGYACRRRLQGFPATLYTLNLCGHLNLFEHATGLHWSLRNPFSHPLPLHTSLGCTRMMAYCGRLTFSCSPMPSLKAEHNKGKIPPGQIPLAVPHVFFL